MSASDSAVVLEDRQRGVEVVATATRRRFTAEYTLTVLREADACTEPGEIGCLLKRGGLYTSHLCLWRKQRRTRELMGLAPASKSANPLAANVRGRGHCLTLHFDKQFPYALGSMLLRRQQPQRLE